ncbi:MAG: hypothetical protein ACREBG_06440 [Pyrinomonadaceae bacterium]
MKRWFFVFVIAVPVVVALLFAAIGPSRARNVVQTQHRREHTAASSEQLKVQVTPWGPTQDMLDKASARLTKHSQLLRYLKGTRSRMLSFDLVWEDEKATSDPVPPNRYRGTFYDYTNNVTIVAESSFDRPDRVTVNVATWQPLPSGEELDEAVDLLKADSKLGPAIVDGRLRVYPPMPPLYIPAKSKGRVERTVNVGLMAKDPTDKTIELPNEVVAVNLSRGTVMRFAEGAPPTSKAAPNAVCGPPSGGTSTGRGVAGQYQFTINAQDGTELWSFLAIRPSASSGSEASGIELQSVKYRGKMLLRRAHVPILNVSYDGNTCGPFRDWQYNESQFNADPTGGTDVAPGVRSCAVPATTQLDTSIDTGNHQGIAFYTQGNQVTLVSEMSAGWYRYISEWGFASDGTLRPRYGMGATSNSCTCNGHVHHAYWRLDFDIDGTIPNRIIQGSTSSARPDPINPTLTTEVKQYRSKGMYWLVKNPTTGRSYQIVPGGNDGTAFGDTYGKGDVWALLFSKNEIDDSSVRSGTSAFLDSFVTAQSVLDTDVVVWYGIHVDHNRPGGQMMGHPNIAGQYVAGPDIIPVRW